MKKTVRLTLRTTFVMCILAALTLLIPGPASAAPRGEQHCLIKVTGKDANGILKTEPMKCYKTYDEVLQARGAGRDAYGTSESAYAAQLQWAIGIHYDGANYTGSSFTVVGTDCNGGGLPVPAGWNDRISSTRNGCGSILHYQHIDYTGGLYITAGGGGNITGAMDNQTSSLRYFN